MASASVYFRIWEPGQICPWNPPSPRHRPARRKSDRMPFRGLVHGADFAPKWHLLRFIFGFGSLGRFVPGTLRRPDTGRRGGNQIGCHFVVLSTALTLPRNGICFGLFSDLGAWADLSLEPSVAPTPAGAEEIRSDAISWSCPRR